jgi:hypothetical protein
MRQYAYFTDLPIGSVFAYNGNACQKTSTRTARLVEYGLTFYFRRRDLCVVGLHSRV